MKYYKEVGFNPLSACLPLLLQLPVFISLVYMLRTDLKQHICGAALKAAPRSCTPRTTIGKQRAATRSCRTTRELPVRRRHHDARRPASC